MSGLLSQAVQNLGSAAQRISSLSGLPPDAQQLQKDTTGAIGQLLPLVQTVQSTGTAFVRQALPQLNEILTASSNGSPVSAIEQQLAVVLAEITATDNAVAAVSSQSAALATLVFGDFKQLATIEANLAAQMTSLQGQLGAAQGEQEAAQKRYYYLLALGPFGLVGLATALGLYLKWKSDVNGIGSQISGLNGEISALAAMQSACELIQSDFQAVIDAIAKVQNLALLLRDSIVQIDNDMKDGGTPLVWQIKVRAAITEITAFGIDIS